MVIVLGMSFGSHIHRKKSSSSSLSSSAKRKERTPTQQTQQPTGIRKKSEFICTTKFNNQLPDVPFDPKFLVFPFTENQFVKYRTTSLEKNYKRPIYTNPTLGMNINVIDPDVYRSSSFLSELDEVDNTLVRDYSSTQKANGGFQLKASWLRRTEYFTPQVEQTFGTSISEDKLNNATEVEELYPEERARKIDKSFAHIPENEYEHPTQQSLKVEKVLPLFPAYGLWMNTNFRATFPQDPFKKNEKHTLIPDRSALVSYTITNEKEGKEPQAENEHVETIANLSIPIERENDNDTLDDISEFQRSESFNYKITNSEASNQQEYVLILNSEKSFYFPINGGIISLKHKGTLSGKNMVKRAKREEQSEAELINLFENYIEEE